MARARSRLEWNQTAELWVLLAESIRNVEEHPDPFTVEDIHPFLRKRRDAEDDRGPDWGLWSKITENSPVYKMDLSKLGS